MLVARAIRSSFDSPTAAGCSLIAICPKPEGCIDFIPIAPDPKTRRRLTEESLEKYARNQNVKFEANELSMVLVLAVNDTSVKTNILLGAEPVSLSRE